MLDIDVKHARALIQAGGAGRVETSATRRAFPAKRFYLSSCLASECKRAHKNLWLLFWRSSTVADDAGEDTRRPVHRQTRRDKVRRFVLRIGMDFLPKMRLFAPAESSASYPLCRSNTSSEKSCLDSILVYSAKFGDELLYARVQTVFLHKCYTCN